MTTEHAGISGEIEVILEDRDGNVKYRERKQNAITEGFIRWSLYHVLNPNVNHGACLRSNARAGFNMVDARTALTSLGIYCMNQPISVAAKTYRPPFVGNDNVSLHPSVSFYNIAGNATETDTVPGVMIPMDARCYYDHNTNQFTLEYIKNTSIGTVSSICIGRDFASQALCYTTPIKDNDLNAVASATTAYVLEFNTAGSAIWKAVSATAAWGSFHFATKENTSGTANANIFTNISAANLTGGVVMGNNIYKVTRGTISGQNIPTTLAYCADWKNAQAVATKTVTFVTPSGQTPLSTAYPVMVARPDNNTLEIFLTVSAGDQGDDGYGCRIMKAIVDLTDLEAAAEFTDLGVYKNGVGNSAAVTVGNYKTGCFYQGKYWLPVSHTSTGTSIVTVNADAYMEGMIIDFEEETIDNYFNYTLAAATCSAPVVSDSGVKMIRPTLNTAPYLFQSQVLSGTNLSVPVVKTEYDLLRVIYRYTLA